jgi:hypothetical protein
MKFRVVHQPAPGHARSPFRVVEQTTGREVDWINRYLDREVFERAAGETRRVLALGVGSTVSVIGTVTDGYPVAETTTSAV